MGLLGGVEMRTVLWALMSASANSLLDACMATVGVCVLFTPLRAQENHEKP